MMDLAIEKHIFAMYKPWEIYEKLASNAYLKDLYDEKAKLLEGVIPIVKITSDSQSITATAMYPPEVQMHLNYIDLCISTYVKSMYNISL